MATLAKHMILCNTNFSTTTTVASNRRSPIHRHKTNSNFSNSSVLHREGNEREESQSKASVLRRRSCILSTTLVALGGATAMLEARRPMQRALAVEQTWGTRSFIKEKYFQPGLSPEESVARIRQTAEGMRDMRPMLDAMSWRYVLFYIRLKSAYLDADLKNVLTLLPENRRKSYIKTANELVDSMSELDRYVRSPKVYESYLYYEKALKSLDELVAMLA